MNKSAQRRIEVVPYDPHWQGAFEEESKLIAATLGDTVVAIHHIGSTAIPGIYAKPIIDMLIELRDIGEVETRGPEMELLGYEVMGEFGIPGRRYFRKDDAEGMRTHQVHTFATGSQQVARHLAFRDFLIAHPEEALQYSDLKRHLATVYPHDANAYMDGKDAFIREIDRRAAVWKLAN